MTEQVKRERDKERGEKTQGNLGQKDAQQEARSEEDIARMAELTKEKNK